MLSFGFTKMSTFFLFVSGFFGDLKCICWSTLRRKRGKKRAESTVSSQLTLTPTKIKWNHTGCIKLWLQSTSAIYFFLNELLINTFKCVDKKNSADQFNSSGRIL